MPIKGDVLDQGVYCTKCQFFEVDVEIDSNDNCRSCGDPMSTHLKANVLAVD